MFWYIIGLIATSGVVAIEFIGTVFSKIYCSIFGWALTVQWFIAYKRSGIKPSNLKIEVSQKTSTNIYPLLHSIELGRWARGLDYNKDPMNRK